MDASGKPSWAVKRLFEYERKQEIQCCGQPYDWE